jgi:glycosyltransferase involved in cell wall biosynthesis
MPIESDGAPPVIAFYLPQFHPISENDEWWGRGFTEWDKVVRARPLFSGHGQPQLPTDLGFYDLRLPEARRAQAQLATEYGISGFCYYYYWFNGTKLLERPLEDMLASGEPDFPFCICWANENWTRRWDGLDDEILIEQEHSAEHDEEFFRDVLPILEDRRYIRVDGKPMLLVYRVSLLPDAAATARRWRALAQEAGLGELYLCAVQSFGIDDPREYGFDAAVEFPPHPFTFPEVRSSVRDLDPGFTGHMADYRDAMEHYLSRPEPEYAVHRGVMVGFDNTARRGTNAYLFHNESPRLYERWLREVVQRAQSGPRSTADLPIFVNAWNEWAEGAHLEPDNLRGHAFLEATRRALRPPRPRRKRGTSRPLVTVVIPSYNHAEYIEDAISSVAMQTYDNLELVVVDDGSTDGSLDVIHDAIAQTDLARTIVKAQPNLGAAAAIDRGVMLGSGDYVTILNSDDLYAFDRIEVLVDEVSDPSEDRFVFSGIEFFCTSTGREIRYDNDDPRIQWYADAIRLARVLPTAGFGLLRGSITATTSNFFFNRALFDKLRGFDNSLKLAHDWDFAIRALHFTEPVFVADPLLTYRYHDTNAHASLSHVHRDEGMKALRRYLELTREPSANALAPTRGNWPGFFDFFCAHVQPWFSDETYEELLVEAAPRGRRIRRRRLPAHEQQAVDALESFEPSSNGHHGFSELYRELSQQWSTPR